MTKLESAIRFHNETFGAGAQRGSPKGPVMTRTLELLGLDELSPDEFSATSRPVPR